MGPNAAETRARESPGRDLIRSPDDDSWRVETAFRRAQLPSKMLKVTEAADVLGVCPLTVRRMIKAGRLPATRVGPKLIRIRASDVTALSGA